MSSSQHGVSVGIDLGTTYSAIACVDSSGHVEVVPNSSGYLLTPSVVFFDGNTIIVGHEAARAALLDPEKAAECFKRDMGRTPSPTAIRPAGHLNAAPIGLGCLLNGGYIGDARTYFCPTAGDNMPLDYVDTAWGHEHHGAANLSQLKAAGGYDARTMTHGDWSGLTEHGWLGHALTYSWCGVGVQGSYNYRLTPSVVGWDLTGGCTGSSSTPDVTDPVETQPQVVVRFTKPLQATGPGCPMFKTQRQLAGRAVVTDTWSRCCPTTYMIPALSPGLGRYAHREGYNALYGDWSAKWVGDPQERLIWWPLHTYQIGAWEEDYAALYQLQFSMIDRVAEAADPTTLYNDNDHNGSRVTIWHLFDTEAGLDLE